MHCATSHISMSGSGLQTSGDGDSQRVVLQQCETTSGAAEDVAQILQTEADVVPFLTGHAPSPRRPCGGDQINLMRELLGACTS